MTYEPELGQAAFGQPWFEHEVPALLEAAFELIRFHLNIVRGNIEQRDVPDPFGNTGESFKNNCFEVCAYSWRDEEQPFNFKCGDIEVRWYKYMGRGMSMNRAVTSDEIAKMLDACLASIKAMQPPSEIY